MKKQIILILFLFISNLTYTQVKQLVYTEDGYQGKFQLIKHDEDSVYYYKTSNFKKDWVSYSFPVDKITKTQTLGIRFINDSYDDYLSSNNRGLEFSDLASHKDFGIHVSGRKISEEVVLLIKVKFKAKSDFTSDLHIHTGDKILFTLSSGEKLTHELQNTYMLHGYILYNFGYIILTRDEIKKIASSELAKVRILDRDCKVNDSFLLSRNLFTLLESEIFHFH